MERLPLRLGKTLAHRAVLGLLFLQLSAAALDVGVALFALFMADRGASPRELGWVLGLGWAAAAAGSLVGGYAADSWGARQGILTGVLPAALGLFGKALARSWPLVGASYLLVQAAQAALYPSVLRCLDTVARGQVGS
ncbi:MAG: MFS transporter, partial [Chloroflexia bacterium]